MVSLGREPRLEHAANLSGKYLWEKSIFRFCFYIFELEVRQIHSLRKKKSVFAVVFANPYGERKTRTEIEDHWNSSKIKYQTRVREDKVVPSQGRWL